MLVVRSAESNEPLLTINHEVVEKTWDAVCGVGWSEDGKVILGWTGDSTLHGWDASTGDELFALEPCFDILIAFTTDWNKDRTHLMAHGLHRGILVWDVARGQELFALFQSLYDARWFSDELRLVTTDGKELQIWSVPID